ncbi:anhydro-N-acetylmuramic acid kinase, partial [Flavobacteriales bacterium]|nr:anhydro-N-acetylmuramic acid kinase [Flavobacteriales bacterium]
MSLNGIKTSAIGIMSGTSLDGLDLCYAEFKFDDKWDFKIIATDFVPYGRKWRESLSISHDLPKESLEQVHLDFGQFSANCANIFLQETKLPKPNIICSHGHTVFHEPKNGITVQIGDGEAIANQTRITCISDFRTEDVALGGEGAPLVPIGDELLFTDYMACLNLGGFSNISFREENERRAFDVCPVNIILNPLANKLGKEYDANGEIARDGQIDQELLKNLNNLPFYSQTPRPSLAREWIEHSFFPLVEKSEASI